MAGERSQPPTRPGQPPGPNATPAHLTEAIQTIEAFVNSANWPERAKDAWKRVKEAAFQQTRATG